MLPKQSIDPECNAAAVVRLPLRALVCTCCTCIQFSNEWKGATGENVLQGHYAKSLHATTVTPMAEQHHHESLSQHIHAHMHCRCILYVADCCRPVHSMYSPAEQAPGAIELDLVRRQILLTARSPSPAAHNKLMGVIPAACADYCLATCDWGLS